MSKKAKRKDLFILSSVFVKEMNSKGVESAIAVMGQGCAGELLNNLVALKNEQITALNLFVDSYPYPSSLRLLYSPNLEHNSISVYFGKKRGETIIYFSMRTNTITPWIKRLSAYVSTGEPYSIRDKVYKTSGCPELTIGTYAKTI